MLAWCPQTPALSPQPFPRVAYVLQGSGRSHWLPLTVGEVIAMGRYPHLGAFRRRRPSDRAVMAECADQMDVTPLMDSQFGELSGGQRQRVLVAQALAVEASILLLDEPITGLDIPSQNRIFALMESESAAGTTIILTTHHLNEARHCDQVALLDRRLVAVGPPDEVLTPDLLRETFGAVLGQHHGHGHDETLLIVDEHGHDHGH